MLCSIDATKEDGNLGRLINHSRKEANIVPKITDVDGEPHLYFIAVRDIGSGEELVYDYGDRRKTTLKHHPWLSL